MSFLKKDMDINELQSMVINLEEQLCSLYDEQAKYGQPGTLFTTLKSLEEQLCQLYAEKEGDAGLGEDEGIQGIVKSLEQQVISLIDEKMELEQNLCEVRSKLPAIRHKVRDLGAAMFEAALFENKKSA